MSVTLQAETAAEFLTELRALLVGAASIVVEVAVAGGAAAEKLGVEALPEAPTEPFLAEVVARETAAVAPPPPEAPRTRKPRARPAEAESALPQAHTVEEAPAAATEAAPEVVAPVEDYLPASDDIAPAAPKATVEDVSNALRALAATGAYGAGMSRDLVYGAGAKRIGEISPELFADVVTKATLKANVIAAMSPEQLKAANDAAAAAAAKGAV
jgi:hypothetical protein